MSIQVDNVITVQLREVYGIAKAYPVNAQAKRLADIAKTKTLSRAVLAMAEQMGFSIAVESNSSDWRALAG